MLAAVIVSLSSSTSGVTPSTPEVVPSGATRATLPSPETVANGASDSPCPLGTRRAGRGCVTKSAALVHHGERCRSARRAVVHYRALTWERQEARGGELADRTPIARGKTCRWARYAAGVHRARAQSARRALRHWRRWVETSEGAIRFAFGPYAEQALAVARCESGHSMTPRAHNGQYLGIFQMGESERATYGHGDTPLEQALAAFAYFVASGRDWSPWSCKP